jgi:hypothetical protein
VRSASNNAVHPGQDRELNMKIRHVASAHNPSGVLKLWPWVGARGCMSGRQPYTTDTTNIKVIRRDRLGGAIHEYMQVA